VSGDAWLFLTPEVEREAPALVGRLGGEARAAEARIEELVRRGDAHAWFAFLRECRRLVDRARLLNPRPARRLALVLREQYLLAPGVPGLRPQDERELARLQEIIDDHRELAWTSA
jgi:hypothetical protein